MKKFKQVILEAGGQAAGKLEVVRTNVDTARRHAEDLFSDNNQDLETLLPNFDKNYKFAQKKAKIGWTKRKDMPVISSDDVKAMQKRLKDGTIDLENPFAPSTDPSDPYPEGLTGQDAKRFLNRGLRDGEKSDDVIKFSEKKVAAKDLKPIQRQIYFDKSIKSIADNGVKGTTNFLTNVSYFICSSDNYIIDGHHRFLSALLVDPQIKVRCLIIDLPIEKLLPLSLAYGDAIGNKRNM